MRKVLGQQVGKINITAEEGGAVISLWPLHIIDVGSVKEGLELGQILVMVQEQEIVLALNMPEVMPIAHVRIFFKLCQKINKLSITGHLLKVATPLYPQH